MLGKFAERRGRTTRLLRAIHANPDALLAARHGHLPRAATDFAVLDVAALGLGIDEQLYGFKAIRTLNLDAVHTSTVAWQ